MRVAFAVQDHDAVLDSLATTVSPRVLEAPGRLDDVARQLDEYFAGRRTTFDVPLDLRLLRGFVATSCCTCPTSPTATRPATRRWPTSRGSPRAVRAVGTACALNPLPVVLPCHRVVRSDGSPGQYAGGAPAKLTLLELETQVGAAA